MPTARAGIQYKLSGNVALRAAAYRGWRMPTLNELFRPFRAGTDATAANPRLKPEKVAGAEVGVDVSEGPLTFAMTAFANRLDDAIANVTLGRGPGTFPGVGFVAGDYRPRQNVRAIQVTGVEASGQARLGPWTLHADASLTDAEVDATAAASFLDGLRPAQTPKFVLSAGLNGRRMGGPCRCRCGMSGRSSRTIRTSASSAQQPHSTRSAAFHSRQLSRFSPAAKTFSTRP
ncbi:TonB-dependent receptor [Sphingomonas daechungensis]|uniref:TonB-dependent receptor n=1 Tax=Sphingomonas daechungensis TaxID=1176646 RepID=A0ABX6T396_9SPHN|nr:TonB-dependent receptor [Sphingomonas daechungensis]